MSRLSDVITAADPATRDRSLDAVCEPLSAAELRDECAALDALWRREENLYARVRALLFLYAIHRFHLPRREGPAAKGSIPFSGVELLFERRFADAIDRFLAAERDGGGGDALSSALAEAYRGLAFQTLADQVKQSVRSLAGNAWMFQVAHPGEQPLRIRPELLEADENSVFPVLRERTPVRMDLTHSGWSDIFFLGMDHPEGARVLNVSIDLAVRGRDESPRPPIETFLRVIDQPVIRLVSLDLGAEAEIRDFAEVFDFAKDYLGLLKAALIASGVVPPSFEGSPERIEDLLATMVGKGRGIEVSSLVRGIPKGSRLAVSTNLLASLIALCMRAFGQTRELEGALDEEERRLIVGRAILGEWLGGSGGGWQDSGGLWPAMKLIEGALARPGDVEFGRSRGRLLPEHRLLTDDDVPPAARAMLQQCLVLVHGGMAQDVGPVLEMVTERYLLRSEVEWRARKQTQAILQAMLDALKKGDIRALGRATHENFAGPIQTIIPWATNDFTERLIERVAAQFGDHFHGFWMLGGMAGGGMGFLFDPRSKVAAQQALGGILADLKRELEHALPFAMEPVVYDFAINDRGSAADLLRGDARMPKEYYQRRVPRLLRSDPQALTPQTRNELRRFGIACSRRGDLRDMPQILFHELFPESLGQGNDAETLDQALAQNGFDPKLHDEIRADLRSGRIGLARNRLGVDVKIEDAAAADVVAAESASDAAAARGEQHLREGKVAVVTLAGGAGSRWTQGAGVVKALHPFCRLAGRHRSFLEVHLAKSRRTATRFGAAPPHVFTTSYLTHSPIAERLQQERERKPGDLVLLSRGRSVGLRLVPMERDLRFLFEEQRQQRLDDRAQRVRDSLQSALVAWARAAGEGSDYRDNLAAQCMHPIGHWYEVPNLLLNGTLARLLAARPGLETLFLHNVDTVGADLDPRVLGVHLERGRGLTFEVVARRFEDRGGGLARVNGRARLVESLALPREEDEFRLRYYNSMSTWIDVAHLLELFELDREHLGDRERAAEAVRRLARRMPTYVTIKEVKKRWGHGQEDVYPVAQFEKLWGDMTALPEARCAFAAVPRRRGQQLKDPAQLDGWLRDGSAAFVESLCEF